MLSNKKTIRIQKIKIFFKFIALILGIIIMVFFLLFFIPIKYVVKSSDINYNNEFYVIRFISETCTDSGCYIIGDQNNIEGYDEELYVTLIGEDPRNYISHTICDNNKFIVYGTLTKDSNGYSYMLNSNEWDILETIGKGGTHKKFITIYDLKCISTMFD